jgi:cytochrome P450
MYDAGPLSRFWLFTTFCRGSYAAGTPSIVDFAPLNRAWSILPLYFQIPLAIAVLVSLILLITRLYTSYRYRRALAAFLASPSPSTKSSPLPPPPIPYTLPFLGSALSFLVPKAGLFWDTLFRTHPYAAGACTLRLGPRIAHILHDPHAVQALFKSRDANRLEFNIQIARTSLGLPERDVRAFYGVGNGDVRNYVGLEADDPLVLSERVNLDTLLRTEAVNELTREFSTQFRERVDALPEGVEMDLLKWLRVAMFETSGRALLGEKILEYYPEFKDDFWDFDRHMLELFFGLPEVLVPAAVKARDNCVSGITRWYEGMEREGLEEVEASTSDVAWEPNYGSRANRARQEMYRKLGLSRKARAGLDLGFTFGLASNAIPATGWMLLHILDPNADKSIYPRVMAELRSAQNADGTLNLPVMFGLPLFQSIFHEVLRLYTDILVARSLEKDHVLPISSNRRVLLHKGTLAFAPCWPGQRDSAWSEGHKSAAAFNHERFLTTDPETGKDVFTTSGTAGRFFPFGGGKSVCPGRVFAKQEVLAATACVLLGYDIEVVGFVDKNGGPFEKFPVMRDGFGGSGVVVQAGDVRVKFKKR